MILPENQGMCMQPKMPFHGPIAFQNSKLHCLTTSRGREYNRHATWIFLVRPGGCNIHMPLSWNVERRQRVNQVRSA